MRDVRCPYCDTDIEINHDDGFGYDEGTAHQQQCPDCLKSFIFYTHISFSYDAVRADCLNDDSHQWRDEVTGHPQWTRRRCKTCDKVEIQRVAAQQAKP